MKDTINNAENLAKEIEKLNNEEVKKLYWIVKGMELGQTETSKKDE